MRMKVKKGDTVTIIAGKDRGKSGKVLRALPREERVVVDGVNVAKRHQRRQRGASAGQIVEKTLPVHVSNVAVQDPESGKPTRIRIEKDAQGARTRVAVKSGKKLD